MNATALKSALRFLAGWGIVVLFAVLLTLIFSFLGAFFCAALAGMMFGSVRTKLWQAVAFSLTFPAVLVAVLHASGSGLGSGQVVVLSLICLGTFWITYLVVSLVIRYERKSVPAERAADSGRIVLFQRQDQKVESRPRDSAFFGSSRSLRALTLQLLEGRWSSVTIGPDSVHEHKLMEINREELVVTVSDSEGRVSSISKAAIALGNNESAERLTFSPLPGQVYDDTLVSI